MTTKAYRINKYKGEAATFSSADKRSHSVLNNQLDNRWYELYLQQFERLWDQSSQYVFDSPSSEKDTSNFSFAKANESSEKTV